MPAQAKILLLDDEQDLLELYKDVLSQLPSRPEIHLANSGARAIALLESEPFNLLISDLKMPKMDGLQVLSIVRRKFPDLRVVVMTSVRDEQYRTRAYAMGVDLFWEKPSTQQEIKLFQDCIASLLEREEQGGFRGVQSKSLMDIVQLECLSQNSSVLKITNGSLEGRIWILNGDIIDAQTGTTTGQPAFQEIASWKAGGFEILPAEPERTRTIFSNYQGLLLDTAQALDEAHGAASDKTSAKPGAISPLAVVAKTEGVEFVIELSQGGTKVDSWGVDQNGPLTEWARNTWKGFSHLGEKLRIGDVKMITGSGYQRHLALAGKADRLVCVGFNRNVEPAAVRESMNKIVAKWVS